MESRLISISGTGENGRIHKDDVVRFAKLRVTPLARRIAEDMGLELSGIAGTGISGKILRMMSLLKQVPIRTRVVKRFKVCQMVSK